MRPAGRRARKGPFISFGVLTAIALPLTIHRAWDKRGLRARMSEPSLLLGSRRGSQFANLRDYVAERLLGDGRGGREFCDKRRQVRAGDFG